MEQVQGQIRPVVTPEFDIENTIKQSNRLVEAKYYLTQMEQRFILLFIAHLPQNATDLCDVTLNLADVMHGMGYDDSGVNYTRLYELLDTIMLKVLTIKSKINNNTWYKTHWVQSIYYNADKKTITVGFDNRLRDDLLQLHKAYVSTSAKLIISFKGKYTARIYLMIKQYLSLGERLLTIDYLVDTFRLSNSYKIRSSKIQDMLNYALVQINERSDITCEIEQSKKGRAIIGWRIFNIRERTIRKVAESKPDGARREIKLSEEEQKVFDSITDKKWNITTKTAYNLLAKYGAKRIYRNLMYCDRYRQGKYNLAGFLKRAIVDDWADDEAKRRADEEHERQKQRERSASINRPIIGSELPPEYQFRVPEKSEKEKQEEEKYKNELRPIVIDMIKRNPENISTVVRRQLVALGLSVDDVLAGKYKRAET